MFSTRKVVHPKRDVLQEYLISMPDLLVDQQALAACVLTVSDRP